MAIRIKIGDRSTRADCDCLQWIEVGTTPPGEPAPASDELGEWLLKHDGHTRPGQVTEVR